MNDSKINEKLVIHPIVHSPIGPISMDDRFRHGLDKIALYDQQGSSNRHNY